MVPQPRAGTNLRVGLLTLLWRLYRQDHPATADDEPDLKAVKRVAADKRMLLHTLAKADLDAGLRQLPEALRAALILTDMEGCPLEDVATILGWSKPRAQISLSNARQLLDCFLQVHISATAAPPAPEVKDLP
jgi:DNA-directed RNA polymerase specialized sigma24 family protein